MVEKWNKSKATIKLDGNHNDKSVAWHFWTLQVGACYLRRASTLVILDILGNQPWVQQFMETIMLELAVGWRFT